MAPPCPIPSAYRLLCVAVATMALVCIGANGQTCTPSTCVGPVMAFWSRNDNCTRGSGEMLQYPALEPYQLGKCVVYASDSSKRQLVSVDAGFLVTKSFSVNDTACAGVATSIVKQILDVCSNSTVSGFKTSDAYLSDANAQIRPPPPPATTGDQLPPISPCGTGSNPPCTESFQFLTYAADDCTGSLESASHMTRDPTKCYLVQGSNTNTRVHCSSDSIVSETFSSGCDDPSKLVSSTTWPVDPERSNAGVAYSHCASRTIVACALPVSSPPHSGEPTMPSPVSAPQRGPYSSVPAVAPPPSASTSLSPPSFIIYALLLVAIAFLCNTQL